MRIDFLAVLLLQAEHHLHRWQCARAVVERADELLVSCDGELCSVFELSNPLVNDLRKGVSQAYNMRLGVSAINISLHDAILVDANGREEIEGALVARVDTVENQANNNFLPRWATFVPELGSLEVDNVANVLHNTVKCTGSQDLIFVVCGDSNQQLGVPVVHRWAQIIPVLEGKVVGIASSSGV